MRVLRDKDCVCTALLPNCPPTTEHRLIDLKDAGKLWAEWGIHGLILVSFCLQVFLFFAAGQRRRRVSRIPRSLLWLAYLSADSVAIFILGHLSIHASGPHHQLLFFWTPFVLLHLGGQHTITAFSMQDNELWRRHLLGLVTQVVVAGYIVSRTSWPDGRLLAAMVLMFLSGCLRYAERTMCLYNASPTKLKESSLSALRNYRGRDTIGFINDADYQLIINGILEADGRRLALHSRDKILSSASALISETPLSDLATTEASSHCIKQNLMDLRSRVDRCRAYNYVSTRLVHIYELLYTKAPLHYYFMKSLRLFINKTIARCPICYSVPLCVAFYYLAFSIFILFPLISTSAALALFVVAKKSQLYSQADVIVSYILLIGAITLEVASLFITFVLSQNAPFRIQSAMWSIAKYIHPAWGTKQWSGMLGQYNMINSLTKQDDAGIMSFFPKWIGYYLDDKTVAHIHICEDLKKTVLEKLLEFGTRQEDWNFANFRGQLALRDRKVVLSPAGSETLYKSINDVDLATTVLIWHIATDILYYFQEDNTNNTNYCQQLKKTSRELSNYIMYLIFKCGVMLTNTTEIQHEKALKIIEAKRGLGEMGAMKEVFQTNRPLNSTSGTPVPPLLPHACMVAQELIEIHEEAQIWGLINAVWLEMLFYIAPRCGGAFHSEHLATGGEFITQVLHLMQLLGPFLKPPGM